MDLTKVGKYNAAQIDGLTCLWFLGAKAALLTFLGYRQQGHSKVIPQPGSGVTMRGKTENVKTFLSSLISSDNFMRGYTRPTTLCQLQPPQTRIYQPHEQLCSKIPVGPTPEPDLYLARCYLLYICRPDEVA